MHTDAHCSMYVIANNQKHLICLVKKNRYWYVLTIEKKAQLKLHAKMCRNLIM